MRLILAIVLGCGALALAAALLAWFADRRLERLAGPYLSADPAKLPDTDLGVVLGTAPIGPEGGPNRYFEYRLDAAAALWRAGKVKYLLASGDNLGPGYDEPTAMRDCLAAHGVPADAVVRDFAGRDTYDSCTRAARIFGVDRVLVVSQGYHLPRAVTTCRAVGLDAEGVGDWTARAYAAQWTAGERREKLADAKTVIDVVSGRDPVLGPVETSVQDALAASAS